MMMKIGVHSMKVASMLRFMKRQEVRQDVKDCRFPKSGGIHNTMIGDHWAALRLLINAIEAPAEPSEDSTTTRVDVLAEQSEDSPTPRAEVLAEQSEYSQTPRAEVDEEFVGSPMCPMSLQRVSDC